MDMMKSYKFLLLSAFMFSTVSFAQGMQVLDDHSLQQIDGQAGVDLKLELRLNHTNDYKFDTTVCTSTQLEYCHLAIAFSNRYDDGSLDTYDAAGIRQPSTTGKKQWIVLKGLEGTILMDKLALDGADVTFKNKSNVSTVRAAIKLGFDENFPIKIRNFGFQSLAIETDTGANESGPGYLKADKYCSTGTVAGGNCSLVGNTFDGFNPETNVGRERGFLGLKMDGNLVLTGSMKFFSCLDHARC